MSPRPIRLYYPRKLRRKRCRVASLIVAITAFFLSLAGTRLSIPWLAKIGAVAVENGRTMHVGVVPKGGGAPLLVAAALALLVLAGRGTWPPSTFTLLAGTLILAAISWRDDLGHVPAALRLLAHASVAALVVAELPPDASVSQGLLPWWADRVSAVLALTWMMNLFNFMDGINGIAGAETIAIACGYLATAAVAGMTLGYEPLAAALGGAAAGFLVWNARKAPLVFLGDVGSVALGFLTGILMLDLAVSGEWAAALIIPGYFFTDATLTLGKRLMRGERVWQAHKSHAYQRAAAAKGSHVAIVGRISIANAMLVGAAMFSVLAPLAAVILAMLIVAALMLSLEATARTRSSGSDRPRL